MKKLVLLSRLGILLISMVLNSCKKEELPSLSTSPISNITASSATSGGNITSNGGAEVTARGICWSNDANPNSAGSKTNNGAGDGQFVSEITDLSPGMVYHVRAYATNSVGTAYGADMTFTTLGGKPECITQPPTNISANGITLNGTVNANFSPASVTFEYGTTTSYGQTISAIPSSVTGNSITNVSATITGLDEGTTYHYRVKAANSIGTAEGSDMTFTTSGEVPVALTQAAANINTTQATLNGIINANYSSTSVTFEYGISTNYGMTFSALPGTVTGNTNTNVSAVISNLNPGTTYHFRVRATNSLGTTFGEDFTFTTLGQRPTVITQPATNVQVTTATLNGTINANSLTTDFHFEYGLTSNYGSTASPTSNQIIGSTDVNVNINLYGLSAGATYHYRVVGTNLLGTTYGTDMTFATQVQAPIVSVTNTTNINSTIATLNGTVNPNSLSTTVIFEYGTTLNFGNTVNASPSQITGSSPVSFTANITGLTANTTYYVRAIASNEMVTSYSNEVSFKTLFPNCGTVTDIDGNVYNSVLIGDRCWMQENLKTTRFNDGTEIYYKNDNSTPEYFPPPIEFPYNTAYFWYNFNIGFKDIYGALYNYNAINSRLCPVGWHVSNYEDWFDLARVFDPNSHEEYPIESEIAGGAIKTTGTIEDGTGLWRSPNSGATNISGFTAIPAGRLNNMGEFVGMGEFGAWWLGSEIRSVNYLNTVIHVSETTDGAFSIRCVRDL